MKNMTMSLCLVLILGVGCKKEKSDEAQATTDTPQTEAQMTENIYQFQVDDLYGESFDFSNLKGKKVMVVNTASECGLTPQYKDLQKLYDTYKDKNFDSIMIDKEKIAK